MCSRNYQKKKRNYRIRRGLGGGGGGVRVCQVNVTRITRKVLDNLNFVFGNLSFGYPDNSAKDRSANDTSAKPEVRMPTVRTRQQCE